MCKHLILYSIKLNFRNCFVTWYLPQIWRVIIEFLNLNLVKLGWINELLLIFLHNTVISVFWSFYSPLLEFVTNYSGTSEHSAVDEVLPTSRRMIVPTSDLKSISPTPSLNFMRLFQSCFILLVHSCYRISQSR